MKCRTQFTGLQCTSNADEYLLYGCYNLHINEIALCAEHASKWYLVQHQYKHGCPQCELFIEEHVTIRMYNGQLQTIR